MNNVIRRSRNLQPENLKKELKLQINLPAAHLLKFKILIELSRFKERVREK